MEGLINISVRDFYSLEHFYLQYCSNNYKTLQKCLEYSMKFSGWENLLLVSICCNPENFQPGSDSLVLEA